MNIIEWRNYLCNDENISSRAKHIGLTLSLFYRQEKRTYPSIDTICTWSSLAPNTVSGALKDLQKAGFIEIKSYRLPNARFRGNEYVFCGLLSDCNIEEKGSPSANSAPTVDAAIEPAIDAAIEPSNFAYKEEEKKKERNKKESKKGENFVLPLPEWLPLNDWNDYLDARNKRGKKATNRAKQLVIIKLDELRTSGNDPGTVLRESILNGWTGVFKLKQDVNNENFGTNFGKGNGNFNTGANNDKHQRTLEAAARGHARAQNPDF